MYLTPCWPSPLQSSYFKMPVKGLHAWPKPNTKRHPSVKHGRQKEYFQQFECTSVREGLGKLHWNTTTTRWSGQLKIETMFKLICNSWDKAYWFLNACSYKCICSVAGHAGPLVRAVVPKLLWARTHLWISWLARDPQNKIKYHYTKISFENRHVNILIYRHSLKIGK